MRTILGLAAIVGAIVIAPAALAQAATPAPAATPAAAPAATPGHYNTTDTDLGTLLDDPAAHAVLQRNVPDLIGNDQISMARGMTLRALQAYAGEALTDAKLATIDRELAALPAHP